MRTFLRSLEHIIQTIFETEWFLTTSSAVQKRPLDIMKNIVKLVKAPKNAAAAAGLPLQSCNQSHRAAAAEPPPQGCRCRTVAIAGFLGPGSYQIHQNN